jgi:hypothetical protein
VKILKKFKMKGKGYMNENILVRAIDILIESVPKLDSLFWIEHGAEVNTRLSGLSGGELRVYQLCLNLWAGEPKIDLKDFLSGTSIKAQRALLKAMDLIVNEV